MHPTQFYGFLFTTNRLFVVLLRKTEIERNQSDIHFFIYINNICRHTHTRIPYELNGIHVIEASREQRKEENGNKDQE